MIWKNTTIAIAAVAMLIATAFPVSAAPQKRKAVKECITTETIAQAPAQTDAVEYGRFTGDRLTQFKALSEALGAPVNPEVDLIVVWAKPSIGSGVKVFWLAKGCVVGGAYSTRQTIDAAFPPAPKGEKI